MRYSGGLCKIHLLKIFPFASSPEKKFIFPYNNTVNMNYVDTDFPFSSTGYDYAKTFCAAAF